MLAGAMAIADPLLDISPITFIERLHSQLALRVTSSSAWRRPRSSALVIAIIGCRVGMTVERDARSIGISTTSTVVQCIVSVILLDAVFAVALQEVGL